MTIKITSASQEDIPTLLKFIKNLATYEKMEDEVTATEEMLANSLFGLKSFAEVIFLEKEDVKVGFALFFHNYSTFLAKPGIYLEDLYIEPEFRGKGFGKKLLTYLAKLAVDRGCGRLEWSVLDWNKPAIDFYLSLGAEQMDEWTVHRLSDAALLTAAQNFEE